MMNTKSILGVSLIFSLIACAVLAYLWIDSAITRSYLESSQNMTSDALENVTSLLEHEWVGLSEEALLKKLQAVARQESENILVKKESGEKIIWYGNVQFEMEAGKLKRIK